MVLTKFFCKSRCKNVFLGFSGNREQLMDSAVALNKTKRDVFKLLQHFRNAVYIFHSANLVTLITVCIKNRFSR